MKDLFVLVADAEMGAFLKALLGKPKALGIREVCFDITRHTGRDSGMVAVGAELTRQQKGFYRKMMLVLDYHGCGQERRQSAAEVAKEMQGQLDDITWQDSSSVIIVEPEFEQWLWYCETAIAKYFSVNLEELQESCQAYADKHGKDLAQIKAECPKGLFKHIRSQHYSRRLRPGSFAKIGETASIRRLKDCSSFLRFHQAMQSWFA